MRLIFLLNLTSIACILQNYFNNNNLTKGGLGLTKDYELEKQLIKNRHKNIINII